MFLLDILVFLLVLGLLVFFHELGHFVAAKACGIYCDRFSLGMPPRVWGFKWGETDYCIGALPIGGYVKMAGQEDAPRTAEEREKEYANVPPERFYNNKPVWQRSIVIAAGPFMNLVLAVLLYAVVGMVGAEVPEAKVDNRIGVVLEESPASKAPMYLVPEGENPDEYAVPAKGEPTTHGWKTGDRVVSINGQQVGSIIQDARIDAVLGSDEVLRVVLERPKADGTGVDRYVSPVQPKVLKGEEHAGFGVGPYTTALVDKVIPGMPAEKAGIQAGDVVLAANGQPIDSFSLTKRIEDMGKEGNSLEPLELLIQRGDQKLTVTVMPEATGRMSGILLDPPMHVTDAKNRDQTPVVVVDVSRDVEESAGLKRKDRIREIDGQPATVALFEQLEKEKPGQEVSLRVERPAILYGLLRRAETLDVKMKVNPVGAIGVAWRPRTVFHREEPADVLPAAFHQSYLALVRTVQTVKMLVTGSEAVRAKDLGGPVMIYQIMADARRLGLNWLLEMTAFISINLCVFNLLPLPVLDGGQLVFLGVEAIRRKPLDMRVLERVQQMGLVFIVLLILFVTFNDIQRVFENIIP